MIPFRIMFRHYRESGFYSQLHPLANLGSMTLSVALLTYSYVI
jgi:hypothetical protein